MTFIVSASHPVSPGPDIHTAFYACQKPFHEDLDIDWSDKSPPLTNCRDTSSTCSVASKTTFSTCVSDDKHYVSRAYHNPLGNDFKEYKSFLMVIDPLYEKDGGADVKEIDIYVGNKPGITVNPGGGKSNISGFVGSEMKLNESFLLDLTSDEFSSIMTALNDYLLDELWLTVRFTFNSPVYLNALENFIEIQTAFISEYKIIDIYTDSAKTWSNTDASGFTCSTPADYDKFTDASKVNKFQRYNEDWTTFSRRKNCMNIPLSTGGSSCTFTMTLDLPRMVKINNLFLITGE